VEDDVSRNPDTDAGPGQQISRSMAAIKQLKAQIERLRKDNEVLKGATVLFARELGPATGDHGPLPTAANMSFASRGGERARGER
jgi:hypothetical protein